MTSGAPRPIGSRGVAKKFALVVGAGLLFLCPLLFSARPLYAAGHFSVWGQVRLDGVYALDPGSIEQDPSVIATTNVNWRKSGWDIHSCIEAGWDGAVLHPIRDSALLKSFNEVYQDNTPYVEFKELYLERQVDDLDLRVGIQRYSWGRLDEYSANDLLNPWDYTRFVLRPLQERKIGIPSISAVLERGSRTFELVWAPWFAPYRLPEPYERWFPISAARALSSLPGAEVVPEEPDMPATTLANGSIGFRIEQMGNIDWAVTFFNGYDPRPVFRTTALRVTPAGGSDLLIDPGFVPSFHRITSIGASGDWATGNWSLRWEGAFAFNRFFDVRQELWGYPKILAPGLYPLNPIEVRRKTLDYGVAADYRLGDNRFFSNGMLTLQAQQTLIIDRPDTLYQKEVETLLWANFMAFRMNRKIELNVNFSYNPEHGDWMFRPSAYYVFTDSLKAGVKGLLLSGPAQSIFGAYADNDQVEIETIYSW